MPKSNQLADSFVALDAAAPTTLPDPAEVIRAKADALYRTASECCRQHERYAHLVAVSEIDAEQRAAREIVRVCDEALATMTAAYEKCTARAHPNGDHEAWWQRANALWHASREFIRRHSVCDRASRQLDDHSTAKLGELQLDYELEASALLSLQHAIDGYRKVRPGVR